MERRFYLGVGILLIILILGLFTQWVMEKCQQPPALLLEQAAQAEDLQTGTELAQQAKAMWHRRWKGVAAVADHSPMDEIDTLFAEMEVYARTEEKPHFAACCSELARRVQAMADAHAFSWWNVL